MSDFETKLKQQIVSIGQSKIPSNEKDVLRLLFNRWKSGLGPITQKEIAEAIPSLGGHKKYDSRTEESTLRQVRQVIRDLRINRWTPILSDHNGYWLPKNEDEITIYLERVAKEILARIIASQETYKALRESVGVVNTFLDKQEKLLNKEIVNQTDSKTKENVKYTQWNAAGVGWICNCPGYKYRKTCRHVEELSKK